MPVKTEPKVEPKIEPLSPDVDPNTILFPDELCPEQKERIIDI